MASHRPYEMDVFNTFDRFFGPGLFERVNAARSGERQGLAVADWAPAVDVSETEAAYVLHAELPAVKKENVQISVENGVLTLSGERKLEKTTDDPQRKLHRVERSYGRFARSFSLPDTVDAEHIAAAYKDGMLEITLPKRTKPVPKGRTIEIA